MMPQEIILIALVLAFPIGYLLGAIFAPIRIRSKNWHSAHPQFEQCHGDDLADVVGDTIADISDLGFDVRGHWLTHNSSLATGQITVMEHPRTLDIAKILLVSVGKSRSLTLLFQTRFEDGTEVATANNRLTIGLPSLPEVTILWMPELRDAESLYRVHSQLRDAVGAGKKRIAIGDDPVAFIVDGAKRVHDHQVETGYYYLDKTEEVYRPTWKGAILMTWRLRWPGRSIHRANRRRRNLRLMRELGIQFEEE